MPLLLMAFLACLDLASDVPATAPLLDPVAAVIVIAAVGVAICDLAGIRLPSDTR